MVLNPSPSVLQAYNNEMIKCIEDLCSRRDELRRQIDSDNEEKAKLHNDIRLLTNKLAKINQGLAQKMSSQNEFDKAISETQAAYSRVMETSQSLLQSVHGATVKLKLREGNENESMEFKLPKADGKREIVGKK